MSPLLTKDECEAIGAQVLQQVAGADAQVEIQSQMKASTAFARGDVHVASEVEQVTTALTLRGGGKESSVSTTSVDVAGLTAMVQQGKEILAQLRTDQPDRLLPPQTYLPGPQIYFDAVPAAMEVERQAELFRQATDAAEAGSLISAGDINLEAEARWVRNTRGLTGYYRRTYGEFSMTARTGDGTGSGWAWSGFEDWGRVDTATVVARTIDLGRRSANPVAVEPGRYTVVLEPAAVAALIEPILGEWAQLYADAGLTVFSKEPVGSNKIGLQMLDRRVSMVTSPWDPDRPASTIAGGWYPVPGPTTWFKEGVLTNLERGEGYRGLPGVMNPGGVRLAVDGPTQTLEEMIASTKRGVWVNRLSHVFLMTKKTLLLSGVTRDGTFLIENGKITKAIKNFRFTESPFFVLNKLEAFGTPVRASRDVVAPRLKLRDFDFTSLTEAV